MYLQVYISSQNSEFIYHNLNLFLKLQKNQIKNK